MNEGLTTNQMLIRIMDQNDASLVTQTELLERAKSVDNHLGELNSKVATNVTKIAKLETDNTKVRAYATAVSVVIGAVWTAINFIYK